MEQKLFEEADARIDEDVDYNPLRNDDATDENKEKQAKTKSKKISFAPSV